MSICSTCSWKKHARTTRSDNLVCVSIMRLNWFLPFLRKKKKSETLAPPSLAMRWAMKILPHSWFADRVTGKPGSIRKLLTRLGPSVLSSPLRRFVQATCLLLFLIQFFYVCWPYSARPAPTVSSRMAGGSSKPNKRRDCSDLKQMCGRLDRSQRTSLACNQRHGQRFLRRRFCNCRGERAWSIAPTDRGFDARSV